MSPPRALIAEDEPLLAQSLAAALASAWPELRLIGIAPNGHEALRMAAAERPEVLFLDIRMPGLTGLEVAAELIDQLDDAAVPPGIVFVTAYEEFALQAFELGSVDYLLKPVNPERLARTVLRLRAQLDKPGGELAELAARLSLVIGAHAAPPAAPLRIIRAGVGNAVRMVPVGDVCYFQATDKYVSVVTRDAELLIRLALKDLLAQLPADRFRQIHRATIVNLHEVAAAVRDESGRVSLRLKQRGETLAVSRVFAEQFRQM